MTGKCEHGLTTKECLVCASPKYGALKMNSEAPSNAAHWHKVATKETSENATLTARVFELEQRCAMLEEQADLDTIRMGRLAESNQKLKDLNREMFVSRCQAHMSAEAAEQDAARFRMLAQQNKHWLGVFKCDPDGAPSDSLDHVELKELLDKLISQEPCRP